MAIHQDLITETREKRNMGKPNFFIVGAPKCGTTTIAGWLDMTPQCFMSPIKEPHFYARYYDAHYNKGHRQHDHEAYRALFAQAGPQHIAIGEASTHYLHSAESIPAIMEAHPDARIVVCLRNPIEMARSMHTHSVFHGNEHITSFERAWRAQASRRAGRRIAPWMRNPHSLIYRDICAIGTQLDRAKKVVPRDKLHCVFMDDLKADPASVYVELCNFLGISPADISLELRNASRARRSHLFNLACRAAADSRFVPTRVRSKMLRINNTRNVMPCSPQGLSETFQRELADEFRSEIKLLASVTGRDLSNWLYHTED